MVVAAGSDSGSGSAAAGAGSAAAKVKAEVVWAVEVKGSDLVVTDSEAAVATGSAAMVDWVVEAPVEAGLAAEDCRFQFPRTAPGAGSGEAAGSAAVGSEEAAGEAAGEAAAGSAGAGSVEAAAEMQEKQLADLVRCSSRHSNLASTDIP